MERTYPYKAWTLLPSFKPVEVELVGRYASYSHQDYGDRTAKGKVYALGDIFLSKENAIAAGWLRIEKQASNLAKSLETLEKKRVALRKAA